MIKHTYYVFSKRLATATTEKPDLYATPPYPPPPHSSLSFSLPIYIFLHFPPSTSSYVSPPPPLFTPYLSKRSPVSFACGYYRAGQDPTHLEMTNLWIPGAALDRNASLSQQSFKVILAPRGHSGAILVAGPRACGHPYNPPRCISTASILGNTIYLLRDYRPIIGVVATALPSHK